MTQFSHIENIINQYFNLIEEIHSSIDLEEYNEINSKIEQKDKLIRKIYLAKKTIPLTQEENTKLELIEEKIRKDNDETIKRLIDLQLVIGTELRKNNKKIKVSNAYDKSAERNSGVFLDVTE